jgi:uncharacterized membrane protein
MRVAGRALHHSKFSGQYLKRVILDARCANGAPAPPAETEPLQAERPSVAAQPLDALPDQPRPATPRPETPGAAPSVPPFAPPPPPPPSPPVPTGPSFEERLGTRWVVWVGGVALALGGVFLVRYSIERGLLGPAVRVFLGGVLGLALVGSGEWLRRRDREHGMKGPAPAHIPSILTAAGTTVAYATVYAAFALYDFISPGTAFMLLGIVALATLAGALLHGGSLAAL